MNVEIELENGQVRIEHRGPVVAFMLAKAIQYPDQEKKEYEDYKEMLRMTVDEADNIKKGLAAILK